jgi:hypothetical protein
MNHTMQAHDQNIQNAWVIFSGQAELAWLKILKPGFRHCSVLLNDGKSWISYDPLSNYTDITVHHLPAEFDLPKWMQQRGHTVLPTQMDKPAKPAPLGLFSCVEAVKRALGIHARLVLTPWQLYCHLIKNIKFQPAMEGDYLWEA